MYEANEARTRREHRHRSENVQDHAARQDGTDRQSTRLRVVHAPGGFAFVAITETEAKEKGS